MSKRGAIKRYMTRKWANTSLDNQEDQGSYTSSGVFPGLDAFIETKIA